MLKKILIILAYLSVCSLAFAQDNEFPNQNFLQAIEETRVDCSEIGEAECHLQLYWVYWRTEDQKPDYLKAMYWLTKAGQAGLLEAQKRLATQYEYACFEDEDCPFVKDHVQRIYWLEKAAAQGYIYAKVELGGLYHDGKDGVERDYQKALFWYRQAANEGNDSSQANLGEMYIEGLGVEKDRIRGLSWLLISESLDKLTSNIDKVIVGEDRITPALKERAAGRNIVKVSYARRYFFTDDELAAAKLIADNMLGGYFYGKLGLRYFKRNSFADYYYGRDESNPEDYEDILYSIVADYIMLDEKEADDVVAKFASELDVPESVASDYIRTISHAIKFRKSFELDQDRGICQQLEETDLIKLAKSVGSRDKSGELLKIIWQNIEEEYFFECFSDFAVNQSGADYSLTHNYIYRRDVRYVSAAVMNKDNVTNVSKYLLEVGFDGAKISDQLFLLGLFEWKLNNVEPSETENYVYLKLHYINFLFKFGYTEKARETYLKLTDKQKDIFWEPLENPDIIWTSYDKSRETIQLKYLNIASSLAASFIEIGDLEQAKFYLNKHEHKYDDLNLIRTGQARQLLSEVLDSKLNKNDLFDYLIDGYVEGTEKPNWGEDFERSYDAMTGWLGAIVDQSNTVRNVASDYLTSIGYTQMGKYLITNHYYGLRYENAEIEIAKQYSERLGDEYIEQFNQRLQRFENTAKGIEVSNENVAINDPVYEHFKAESRPDYFVRKELDEQYWSEEHSEVSYSEEELNKLGIDIHPYQIVRLERKENKIVVIYTSSVLDPTGEISGGGYWILSSDDGGKNWDEPYYTGLQLFFPYIIMPNSKLPLITDDGLNIEVIDKELDKSSISFPPMGLRPLREVKNIYINVKLDDLSKDQDQDGLTDLFEYKIGLSYLSSDTDNDGISDRIDSLPLIPYEQVDQAKNDLALALAEKLLGYRKQALVVGFRKNPANIADIGNPAPEKILDQTMFLFGSSEIFRNTELPFRLIVSNSPEFLDRQDQNGVFYPVRMSWVFSRADGNRHYIDWTASWAGGAFSVMKSEDGYKLVSHSDWVT